MESTNQKIISKLNHLIAIAEDGKYGYETAAADIKDNDLKNNFLQFAKERTWYATQLKQQVSALGGVPKTGDGPLGVLHRTWIDLKASLTSRNQEAIINACITGEETAIKEFNEALKENYIQNSSNVKSILSEQLLGIENALDVLKSQVENAVLK
jgi:uncharacterized protein (TIGR02284 family)